ncbi:MAG: AIR synthase-related protein, partial [Nitrospinota bacterium]|nr:AIR synthase-related protein [Nitrospinota bacterium]
VNMGQTICPGNLIVGLVSNGVHANGLSLARKVLLGTDRAQHRSRTGKFEEALKCTLGQELLKPTRIYVPEIIETLDTGLDLKAMVHITGGGFNNLNRVASRKIRFVIDALPPIPPIFHLIQERGEVSDAEMFEVFNMGIGFCIVVEDKQQADQVIKICEKHDTSAQVIGFVETNEETELSVFLPKIGQKGLTGRGHNFQASD